jgi:hypothetical protein
MIVLRTREETSDNILELDWKSAHLGTSWFVPFTKYYAGIQITDEEKGGSFGMHGRGQK